MEIRMGGRKGLIPTKQGLDDRMAQTLDQRRAKWLERLHSHPDRLESVEREVHGFFRGFADEMVAGLLAEATRNEEFEARVKN